MFGSTRRPLRALLSCVVLVSALLAGCGGGPSRSAQSPGPGPSNLRPVPVYYVKPAEGIGPRLYREFHPVHLGAGGDPGTAAVTELLARDTGVDPDYRSLWPRGWRLDAPVHHADGMITVDLAAPPTAARPAAQDAPLAVQQLVYTVQGALGSTDPVRIVLAGRPTDRLWDLVPISAPIAPSDPYKVRSLVQIDGPGYGATVGRSTRVTGEAAVFEATVLWQVLQGGTVVRHGAATTAEGQQFSPYSFTVALDPGDYTLRVYQDDPSGGEGRPPMADTKPITVR